MVLFNVFDSFMPVIILKTCVFKSSVLIEPTVPTSNTSLNYVQVNSNVIPGYTNQDVN